MVTAIVVDDDSDTVEIFSSLLEESNIKVVGKGYNGKEAIELYEKYTPEVVFVDIMMPDGNGFHAIRNIQKINDQAKIIAVTADVTSSTVEKLDDLEITGIVYKPLDMDKILQLVNN
ncbi:MAG: response regulator [Nitrosopumilus sp.]|nr:response regulator [Nitrosopumilus sp.]MDC4231308.1 response regulator [Nitrosopumilus sp.]